VVAFCFVLILPADSMRLSSNIALSPSNPMAT
jgi:hypothetical protein